MERRRLVKTLAVAAITALVPSVLRGAERVYRIGYLTANLRSYPWVDDFVRELAERGYVEGKNLNIEWREAKGQTSILPELADDLVKRNLDAIVVVTNNAAKLVQERTKTVPIIVLASHDGVGAALYSSLSHPGANITGIDSLSPALDTKRVQYLKEAVPTLSRLAVLSNPLFGGTDIHLSSIMSAAKELGIEPIRADVRSSAEFEPAFSAVLRSRVDGIVVVTDPMLLFERKRIVDFAIQNSVPSAYEFKEYVQIGGLLSYGATFEGMWRRGAYYVDKVLKGTKPSELPVELPTQFNLAFNIKAARILGVEIPQSLLATANDVIE
ncbi:MAG: ABC transporter substrate-binding protein [bacterium]|nr:ABC transporter substrate-binding protein [bacterium]